MNSKEKREEIVALIDNIKEHSDRLTQMPHMPLLEVSAILSKINRLHENTVVLKYLLAKEQDHEDEEFGLRIANKLKELEEEELEEEEERKRQEEEEVQLSSEEEASEAELDLEEDLESFTNFDDDNEQDDDLEIDEDKIDLQAEFEISADIHPAVQAETTTQIEELEKDSGISSKSDINELYAEEKEDLSLSEQLKKRPIGDLISAIGINERYLYANDLFEGDMEEFKKVVGTLNELESEEKAVEYFDTELRVNYDWTEENELADALLNLVRRRFQN